MPAAGLEAARTSSSCRSSNNPLLAQSSSSIDGFLCIDRHGFVELPPSVPCTAHCYAWLDGPAILWGACVDCCGKDGSVETADHTPHQAPGLKIADSGLRINGVKRLPPGQYKLWLSCSHVEAAAGSTLEVVRPGQSKVLPNRSLVGLRGASVGAYKEAAQIDGSPFSLRISGGVSGGSNGGGKAPRCRRGDAPGQWLANGLPGAERGIVPGPDASLWRDSHVWTPNDCAYKSFSRRAATRCLSDLGGMLLLLGDSEMRGVFVDMDNWLHRKLERLPPYTLNAKKAGWSSWDGLVSGFNPKGNVSACNRPIKWAASTSFFPEDRAAEVLTRGDCSTKHREFALKLDGDASVGYVEALGLQGILKQVERLAELGFRTVDGKPVRSLAMHSCLWDLRYKRTAKNAAAHWDWISNALKDFEGQVVLLTCPPQHHDVSRELRAMFSPRFSRGLMVGMHESLYRMEQNHTRWHVLDITSPGMARPDRTLDGQHYFMRKCVGAPNWETHVCSNGTLDVRGCCLPVDSFPLPVSFTWVQMLFNVLSLGN